VLARRCFVTVDELVFNDRYNTETQIVRKAVDNAWNTNKTNTLKMSWGECSVGGITLSWERIYQMIGKDIFYDFVEMANDLLKVDVLKMMSAEVFEKLSFVESNKKNDFINRLRKEKGVSPFRYLFEPANSETMEGAQAAENTITSLMPKSLKCLGFSMCSPKPSC
jgi:hypothetical protein